MKKLLKYLPLLLTLLWSCDPMEDIYNDLDKVKEPYNEEINYVLVADDYNTASKQALVDAKNESDSAYAKAIKSDMAFNQVFTANDYMRYVLHANYVALNKGSVAKVEYNTTEKPEELISLESTEQYRLGKEDYALVEDGLVADGEGFYPGYEAESYIPDMLAAAVAEPMEGDLIRVNYKYFYDEPEIGYKAVFNETFDDGSLGQMTKHNIAGTDLWLAKSYSTDFFAEASGYNQGACEDWLVSDAIDLSKSNDVKFQVNQYVNYLTSWDDIAILISTDYSGDVTTATWEEIVVNTKPAGNNHDFVLSEMVDISAYDGETCYIAFKYTCSASAALRWRLNDLTVYEKGITGDYDTREIYYEFNGSNWIQKDGCLLLAYSDYEAMGAPGNYHNFSASDAPENYLPVFLTTKYPYSQEGDMLYVGYRYYADRKTSIKVDKYVFEAGQWTSDSRGPVITVTNQFVHNGTTWLFDPTIKFTMVSDDYQLVVDHVKNNISEDYVRSSGDSEYYYGASAYYSNFDLRISNRVSYKVPTGIDGKGWDDLGEEKAIEVIWSRLPEGLIEMLKGKYPGATTQVGGIDVYYEVTFKTYENDLSSSFYTYKFKCTKSGPNPDFEFIEEITAQN